MPGHESNARPWFVAVLVISALVWAYLLVGLRAGVPGLLDDVWEYGVSARHLLAGHGFRTSVIHPPLWSLRDAALTVPILVHGPLLPVLLAPLLALFGAGALDHIAWLAAAFALSTAVVLFRLGTRHFGPAVGAAAALLYTLSPLTVANVCHDVSVSTGGLLLLLTLDLLARERTRHAVAAVTFGLGTLVRPEMVFAIGGLSMLAGGAGTVRLALGVVLANGGWWWHTLRATGSPFFNLSSYLLAGYSERWPELSLLRNFSMWPSRWPAFLAGQAPWLPHKVLENLPHALKRVLCAPSGLTGWLAALGLFVTAARCSTRRVAVAALGCALVPVAVMSLTVYDPRYLGPFLPLWALGAAVAAEWLWGFLPRVGRTRGWVAVLALLVLPSSMSAFREVAGRARRLETWLARDRAALASRATPAARLPRLTMLGLVRPDDSARDKPRLMFTDTPDFVAWTTGRPAAWVTREEYRRLPAPGDSLPERGGPGDTWFHDAVR